MRRRINSRIFLSILLLWQLSAGMFTHAHGISGHDERRDALAGASLALEMRDASIDREAVPQSSMAHSHCHEQADTAGGHSDMRAMDMDTATMDAPEMDEAMVMPVDESVNAQQTTHRSDCCHSLLCKCPCAHTVALYFPLPHAPVLKPSSLTIIAGTEPMLHAGLSGQFRPPI